MARPWSEPVAGHEPGHAVLPDDRPPAMPHPAANFLRALVGDPGPIEALQRFGTLVARLLISQIFIISGFMKIVDWSGTEDQMASRGMVGIPFFHVAALLVELGAGLSLLLGYQTRLGALVLFLFLIPVTLTFHNFWTYPDPKEQQVNMIMFMHNLTLMGGLLLVMTIGPGPFSIDYWRRKSS
jgi:putative oxidoreductase